MAATNRDWTARALGEIGRLAGLGREFTADDVLEAVGHPDQSHAANARNNLIGQVFREARKAGMITPVGVTQSRQPHRKGGLVRVWGGARQA